MRYMIQIKIDSYVIDCYLANSLEEAFDIIRDRWALDYNYSVIPILEEGSYGE